MNFTDEQIKQLETSIGKTIENELVGTVSKEVASQMDEATKNLVKKLELQRQVFGHDAIGLSAETRKAFAESVVTQKALYAEDSEQGGVLVPDEVVGGILRLSETYGHIMSKAQRFDLPSGGSTTVPRDTEAELLGEYLDEDGSGSEDTTVKFENARLAAKQWITLMRIDNRLLNRPSARLGDYLIARIAKGLAARTDKEGFAGTGAPFVGITQDANVTAQSLDSGETAIANVDWEDIVQMESGIAEEALDGAAYYMHRTVWAFLKTLETTGGQLILGHNNPKIMDIMPGSGPRARGTINGYPVFTTPYLPTLSSVAAASTPFMVFGDLANMAVGLAEELRVDRSGDATIGSSNVFAKNQTAFRGLAEHAVAVGNPQGLMYLKTAAS